MNEIRMVDLSGQYLRYKAEIDAAIQDVLQSTSFINGPQVGEFEEALSTYMGCEHCISCGSGTDALQIAMMGLDLQPGDEVITTPFTFISTIEVIRLLRLKPILADIDPQTFNIDPRQVEKAITDRTKAIVPVHLFGQSADMNALLTLADKFRLHVIEDNAQAIGATYKLSEGVNKKAGTLGTIGCTSFFPSKNLGAYGDGGALFTDDDTLAKQMRSIANHGMSRRYHYDHVGVNSRLDTLQAAILKVKLNYLDQYNSARKTVAERYDSAFKNLPGLFIPFRNTDSEHIFHQYTLQVEPEKRDTLKKYLEERNIPAMIYYPVPLHLQAAYDDLGYGKGDFPVTEMVCRKVLSLPIHTEMDEDQLDYIIDSVTEFINN